MGITVLFVQLRPLIDRIQRKVIRVCFQSNVLCICVSMPNQLNYSTRIHRCFSNINWKYKVLECQIIYAAFFNCIEKPLLSPRSMKPIMSPDNLSRTRFDWIVIYFMTRAIYLCTSEKDLVFSLTDSMFSL